MKTNELLPELLTSVFSRYFGANYFTDDFNVLRKELGNPNHPNRASDFKHQLAKAINYNLITPEILNNLTKIDYETQEEVDDFLINEIWKPLYGDEPIKL